MNFTRVMTCEVKLSAANCKMMPMTVTIIPNKKDKELVIASMVHKPKKSDWMRYSVHTVLSRRIKSGIYKTKEGTINLSERGLRMFPVACCVINSIAHEQKHPRKDNNNRKRKPHLGSIIRPINHFKPSYRMRPLAYPSGTGQLSPSYETWESWPLWSHHLLLPMAIFMWWKNVGNILLTLR